MNNNCCTNKMAIISSIQKFFLFIIKKTNNRNRFVKINLPRRGILTRLSVYQKSDARSFRLIAKYFQELFQLLLYVLIVDQTSFLFVPEVKINHNGLRLQATIFYQLRDSAWSSDSYRCLS